MTNLVVLSYGRENEYRRAILAVLSYYSWLSTSAEAGRTVIFTDNAAYFHPYLEGLTVDYISLTRERVQELNNVTGYPYRVKVSAVQEAFEAYPDANVLFIDSDTFVMADPAPLLARISPQVRVMHLREFVLEQRRAEDAGGRLLQLLESQSFQTSHGEERFNASQSCWNSGVLGLDPTVAAYISDVFQLTDKFYLGSGWHISEQIAFSLLLQTRSEIIASDDVVFHYWPGHEKAAVDALILGMLTAQFVALPLAEKLRSIRTLTAQLPTRITEYLQANPHVKLRLDALYAFSQRRFAEGYGFAGRYLLKKPTDTKFMRDMLYYTRQMLKK
jgi:hypothetical protein